MITMDMCNIYVIDNIHMITFSCKVFFEVDSSGVVTTAMSLDRETMATHSFTVQVCDSDPTHCE